MADSNQEQNRAQAEAARNAESREAADTGAGDYPAASVAPGAQQAGMGGERSATGGPGASRTPLRDAGVSTMASAGAIGGGAVSATRDVLSGAIGATEEVGSGLVGGVAHLATDLVHGVTKLGYEVRDGANGLLGAVGDVGGTAVNTVAHLLVDVVGGVRQVVAAAVGTQGGTPVQGSERMGTPGERPAGTTAQRAAPSAVSEEKASSGL
jgi:hypothetical protein